VYFVQFWCLAVGSSPTVTNACRVFVRFRAPLHGIYPLDGYYTVTI
jgi:hypothetical protein